MTSFPVAGSGFLFVLFSDRPSVKKNLIIMSAHTAIALLKMVMRGQEGSVLWKSIGTILKLFTVCGKTSLGSFAGWNITLKSFVCVQPLVC